MSKPAPPSAIRLRGVRHNNLKNFDLDLPLHRLIVVTGLSGSGKSSLAFDTLFAEGQRRYIETFSPYARQFFDRMDKPRVDSIEGIPPAIAIEQRNAVRSTRSTVGTLTEICDYLKVLWPQVAQLHCRQCGKPVRKEPPQAIWTTLNSQPETRNLELLVTFDLALSEKLSLTDSLALVAKQGYQRLLVENSVVRLDDAVAHPALHTPHSALTVVQDRLKFAPANRARFIEACEQAYHFGKDKLAVREIHSLSSVFPPRLFSNRLHCARCNLEYCDPSPALFSFNHPVGACPACRGFGRIISIDYNLAVPDRSLTLAQGAVKPWRTGFSAECQDDLRKFCRIRGVPMNVPFRDLPPYQQDWVIHGDKDYGMDDAHEWPRAWYGVKGYFKWLEGRSYKMHVRVLLSRYRAYATCPDCGGARLQPDALLYLLSGQASSLSPSSTKGELEAGATPVLLTLADFYALPVDRALAIVEALAAGHSSSRTDPLALVLGEVRARLSYLVEVGLGYLTLDRPTRTLSGGETERVNLTTCLGTRLVNTLYVLDEPSVGLHPRDTARLIRIVGKLRDAGNTVVVVEHEAGVMRAADQIVDLGPGHGATGGEVVFQGAFREILRSPASLTGQYLSGRKRIEIPNRRPVGPVSHLSPSSRTEEVRDRRDAGPTLRVTNASRHNLHDLTVAIPLARFVCLTGVSGSGKTTLARDILLPALAERLNSRRETAKASDRLDAVPDRDDGEPVPPATDPRSSTLLSGWEHLRQVVLVDQSPLGKTPRSNPAVYVGAFDDIREVFAQTDAARQRGLNASAFSFNSAQGQCERCRGAGFEKIEMQFLSDVFIRCPDCDGRRYRHHILEVKVESRGSGAKSRNTRPQPSTLDSRPSTITWSIADLLDATVDEVVEFLAGFPESKPARRAAHGLALLQEVGLGYLRLGQPINTLSGGESQRLKLVSHLAEARSGTSFQPVSDSQSALARRDGTNTNGDGQDACPTLFIFDEPTTGLHFDDVRVLLQVFQRLVDAGHSVLVIEHNLDVIKCADWVIDLGPEAGDGGGKLVAQGTPEDIAACEASHTGRFLRDLVAADVRRLTSKEESKGTTSA